METRKLDHLYRLTNRENEIMQLVAEGWSNKQVAEKLYISIRTVKFHTGNIYSKLGLCSRAEVISWIWRNRAIRFRMEEMGETVPKYRFESQG